jgi:hypothetical protein
MDFNLVIYRIDNKNLSGNQNQMKQGTELTYKLLLADPDWKFTPK